ncbi:response regulator [Gramella sp. AN32]|uniref:Response regulator n=1 Tax=Christiangramia antarctica TaxID=2058158 RepID=A0ABW5X795_9FLAO|nr:response regulator [Gramella sp. AN32]MCM4154498.1 response regulator [Gramella sp. AN32]
MKKIYLVDDQPIANFITKKLLEIEGFSENVFDFTDPVMAFQKISEEQDAIIFLDLNMPKMNGWQFLEELQQRNIKHTIIILSSSTSEIDKTRASTFKNVVKYMEKPMNRDKFSELSTYLKTG